MPAGSLPDEGIAAQLSYILSATISGVLPWQLMLFVNDLTPDATTILADLTEATWPGYSRVTLDRGTWTTPTVLAGCATSTYGTVPQTWYVGVLSSPVTNYGAAFVDASSSVLRWVQRFDDADIAPITTGGRFLYLPQYTLTSAACGSSMTLVRKAAKLAKARKANNG
jgi:hypothetical protein